MSGGFTRGFDSGFDIADAAVADTAGDVASADEIRAFERAMRKAREAREEAHRDRRRSEERLAELIDRTYRRVVLKEPEVAAEIAAAANVRMSDEAAALLRAAIAGDAGLMDTVADRLRDWLEAEERARLQDEDDIETLLLLLAA